MPINRQFFGLLGVLLGLFAVQSFAMADQNNVQQVAVDAVRAEPLTETVPIIARLVALRAGAVASEIAGKVVKLPVKIGDHVEAGTVIAEVDTRSRQFQLDALSSQLIQDEADLASAQAQVKLAAQDLERNTRLKGTNGFNRSRFDQAQAELLKARAMIARGRAAITTRKINREILQLEIERSQVRAPYSAVVVAKNTELGSYLRVGDPVLKLISDQSLEIEADIPAQRLPGLTPGVEVKAVLEDGTSLIAVTRAVLPVENPSTRTRAVRFTPKWPSGITRLAEAQSITLNVPMGAARNVVTVHKDAILHKSSGSVVFIVNNGKATSRQVKLGIATGSRIEVIDGLKTGDLAVVRGNERLHSGAAVKVNKGS